MAYTAGRSRNLSDQTQTRSGAHVASSRSPPANDTLSQLRSKLTSFVFVGLSMYALHEARLVHYLLDSRKVNSTALAITVLSSTVTVILWGYLDLFVGTIQGKRIQYHDVKAVTHAILGCLSTSFISFTIALWPVYGILSLVLVTILAWGVFFQLIVLLPSHIYNLVLFLMYAAFVYLWTR